PGHCAQRAKHLRTPAGRQYHPDVFYLCVRQHGYGVRPAAGGGYSAAAGELRWHGPADTHVRLWPADGHQHRTTPTDHVNRIAVCTSAAANYNDWTRPCP